MKKNGFTLVELLAVVTIISILLLLVAPKIVNQLNNSKNDVNEVTKKIIYSAAEKYIKDNNMKIEYDYCLSVEELQDKEYLSDTITDNKSGLDISKKSIRITPKDNLKYEYELTGECTNETGEDYRGYYADVDGDGTVDGIIYADLGANIQYPQSGVWYNEKKNLGQGYGTYLYDKATGNLNEYIISNNAYKKNDGFGENKIVKLKKDNNNPRFYVMALEDFATTDYQTFYWYKNASGKMSTYADDTKPDFGKGYENTGKIIGIWNEGESGKYTAAQDNRDIFKHIQEKYNSKEKWYIPSSGEWGAFADYLKKKTTNPLTHDYESGSYVANSGNYKSLYGLSKRYWSSSQNNSLYALRTSFDGGYMILNSVDSTNCVRLGATF